MFLATAVGSLLTGGGAAAAGGAAAGAATTGLSISSVLQGIATVGGLVAAISAGNQESQALKMQAKDAEAEKTFETVQSVDRKRSLLAAAQDAKGEINTAYAGSGVDLSFGSAQAARTKVFREADLGLTTDSSTTQQRLSRLTEKAANFRLAAKNAKIMGWLEGGTKALFNTASLFNQR